MMTKPFTVLMRLWNGVAETVRVYPFFTQAANDSDELLQTFNYSDSQPRDAEGQFASTGASGRGGAGGDGGGGGSGGSKPVDVEGAAKKGGDFAARLAGSPDAATKVASASDDALRVTALYLHKNSGTADAAERKLSTQVRGEIKKRQKAGKWKGHDLDEHYSVAAENDETIPESDLIRLANADAGEGVFEVKQGDALFIPFGEYPHPKGLQKFDRQSADFLAHAFNSLSGKLSRIFTPGVPIYRGHPDVPGRPDSDPAAPAMGWVQDVVVAENGVSLPVKWNVDGATAIQNAHYRFYSPNWLLRAVKGGIQPVKLLSLGLTNNPRIPVPAIANDEPSQDHDMKLTALLRKLFGFAENDEPTPEELDAKATALEAQLAQLTAAANDAQTALAARTGERDALQGQVTAAQSDLMAARLLIGAANDAATKANERFIDGALGALVESARVLPAERDALRGELLAIANDAALVTRLSDLAKGEPKMKTSAVTKGLGADKSRLKQAANDEAERSRQRREAIGQELTAIANDAAFSGATELAKYDFATERARVKHPTLFPTTKANA